MLLGYVLTVRHEKMDHQRDILRLLCYRGEDC